MAPPAPAATPRARNPRGEGARLRTELLDAAADLMAKHGSIDKVSVRAVAAAAGVSPTAVYRHFDNHMDLLWAAVHYSFDEFTSTLIEAREAAGDDVYDKFRAMGDAYVRFALEQTGKYRVMFSNRVHLPLQEAPVGKHSFDQLIGFIGEVLEHRGDDRDPVFVSVQVWTWIHGIVDLVGSHPEMPKWPPMEALMDDLMVRLDLTPR